VSTPVGADSLAVYKRKIQILMLGHDANLGGGQRVKVENTTTEDDL
jgi:hypothetical protein